MSRHALYAYVDGPCPAEVARALQLALEEFVARGKWRIVRPRIVHRIRGTNALESNGDLPDRELGLDLDLPEPFTEPGDWLDDVDLLAVGIGQIVGSTGQAFVAGLRDDDTGVAEDLLVVEDGADLAGLRELVELRPPFFTLCGADQARVDALPPAELERIDAAILGLARERWLEVSFIVGNAMQAFGDEGLPLPHRFFLRRLVELIERGSLELRGNLYQMGASEVRLPARGGSSS